MKDRQTFASVPGSDGKVYLPIEFRWEEEFGPHGAVDRWLVAYYPEGGKVAELGRVRDLLVIDPVHEEGWIQFVRQMVEATCASLHRPDPAASTSASRPDAPSSGAEG